MASPSWTYSALSPTPPDSSRSRDAENVPLVNGRDQSRRRDVSRERRGERREEAGVVLRTRKTIQASSSLGTSKVDYIRLVHGRGHSIYLALASSLIGFNLTGAFVYARYIVNEACDDDTVCLELVALKVFGFSLYALCLFPKWRRSDNVEKFDSMDDEEKFTKRMLIVSAQLVVSITLLFGVVWLSLDKDGLWLFLPRTFWLHSCSYLLGSIAIFGPILAALHGWYSECKASESLRKSGYGKGKQWTYCESLRQALPFPGEGLFFWAQVAILIFGVIFWLMAFSIRENMVLCLKFTCACIILTWILLNVGIHCLRHSDITRARLDPDQDEKAYYRIYRRIHSLYASVFFFTCTDELEDRVTEGIEVLSGDIVWGVKLLLYPLDCGNSLVVMVVKQLMTVSFCFSAVFSYWGHMSTIRNSYTLQCIGPKGLAMFVTIPEDPLTSAHSPWITLIERLCTEHGSSLVDTPFKFEYIVSREVGMLFSVCFLVTTLIMMWALLLYNYLASSSIHPEIWDECLHWGDPYASKFPGQPLHQLLPEQSSRALNSPLRARVYLKGRSIDVMKTSGDEDIKKDYEKGRFIDIPKTPVDDDFKELVASIEAYHQVMMDDSTRGFALLKDYAYKGDPFAKSIQDEKQLLTLLKKNKDQIFKDILAKCEKMLDFDIEDVKRRIKDKDSSHNDPHLMDDFVDLLEKTINERMLKIWWTSCLQLLLFMPVLHGPQTEMFSLEKLHSNEEHRSDFRIIHKDEFAIDIEKKLDDGPRKRPSVLSEGYFMFEKLNGESAFDGVIGTGSWKLSTWLLHYNPPSMLIAIVPLIFPALLAWIGCLRDFPSSPLFSFEGPLIHGEIPFSKYRFLSSIWMWYFTAVFFAEFGIALRSYFHVAQGYEYLSNLTAKESALPFFMDIGGECITITSQDIKNKKDYTFPADYEYQETEASVKDNLILWTALRRYLRLVLVLPKVQLSGLLSVSILLFIIFCSFAVVDTFQGSDAFTPLARAVLETSKEVASELTMQARYHAMQAQSDIIVAANNASQQMHESIHRANTPASASFDTEQNIYDSAASIYEGIAPYKERLVNSLVESIQSQDYGKYAAIAMLTLERLRTGQMSTFTFQCIVYVLLLSYYTLRTMFTIAVVNDCALRQADSLVAAKERSSASTETPELRERLDVALESTRFESKFLLQRICGKVVTMGVVIAVAIAVIYPQQKKLFEHLPLLGADVCRHMAKQSVFVEAEGSFQGPHTLYNSTMENAFSTAEQMVSQTQGGLEKFLDNEQSEVITSITKAHLSLSEMSNNFDAMSSNHFESLQSKMDNALALLSQKAMVHLELARNLVRETTNNAHAWVEGNVNRVATSATGVVSQILDTIEQSIMEFKGKLDSEVNHVRLVLGGNSSHNFWKLQSDVDALVVFLGEEIIKSRVQLRKALMVAASMAHGSVEAAHTQISILGQTLVNLESNTLLGIRSSKESLQRAFRDALHLLSPVAQDKVRDMQKAIDEKIEIVLKVINRTAKTVGGDVGQIQTAVIDIARASTAKLKHITQDLPTRVAKMIHKLTLAQIEIDESATQVVGDLLDDKASRVFTRDSVGAIQGHLDTAESMVNASLTQIMARLSDSNSYVDAGTEKKAQDVADKLRNDVDHSIAVDLRKIEVAENGIRNMMGHGGVEVFHFVTLKIQSFLDAVHQLIEKAHTTTPADFDASKKTIMTFITLDSKKGFEEFKGKMRNFEQAIMSNEHNAKSSIIDTARLQIAEVEAAFRNAVLILTSSVNNMHVWVDGTFVVADESISSIITTANQKLEELVTKILVRKRSILSAFSTYDLKLDVMENTTKNGGLWGAQARKALVRAVEESVAYLEGLKIILNGALSTADSESNAKLSKLCREVEQTGSNITSATKDLVDSLHFRQEMLKEYITIHAENIQGASKKDALEQAWRYIEGNLTDMTEVVERGAALARLAVGSADSAAKGVLSATAGQFEAFVGSINLGIDITEDALMKKQNEISSTLQNALKNVHASQRNTIDHAQIAFKAQFSDLKSDMSDGIASLGQAVQHVAGYASGNLTNVKDAIRAFAKQLRRGLENARVKSRAATSEINDLLVEKVRMSRLLGKESLDNAHTRISKSLDNTLILAYRKIGNLTDTISAGIQSLEFKVRSGIDSSFDSMATTLKTTLDIVRVGLNDLMVFMKSRTSQAFQIMRTTVHEIAERGAKVLGSLQGQVRIPPMNLQSLFDQYVCRPLTLYITNKVKSANRTLDAGQKSRMRVEKRSPRPIVTAAASRRLKVSDPGEMTAREDLADAVINWWQQEDQRYLIENGVHAGPEEISARHEEVIFALGKLQEEIQVAQEVVVERYYEHFLGMHLGLTKEAVVHLNVLKDSNILLSTDAMQHEVAALASDDSPTHRVEM